MTEADSISGVHDSGQHLLQRGREGNDSAEGIHQADQHIHFRPHKIGLLWGRIKCHFLTLEAISIAEPLNYLYPTSCITCHDLGNGNVKP